MNKLTGLMLGLGLALSASAAEPSVGTMNEVQGGVMVVNGDRVARPASEGMALADGATVLTARDGAATVVLNNGCRVPIKGSQQLRIDSKLECKALLASVQELLPAGGAAAAAEAGTTAGGAAGATQAAEAGAAAAGSSGGVGPGVIAGVAALALVGAAGGGGGGDDHPASGQ